MDFLQQFQRMCEGTEVPPIFGRWTALSGITAVLGRSVWINRGHFTLYPNLYIVLTAGAASRKSASLDMLENALLDMDEELMPNMTSQRESPEAFIEELRTTIMDRHGVLKPACMGYGLYDEFVTFMNRRSYESGLGDLVNSLFNCRRMFKYRTKARGVETIQNGWFSFVGAATIEGLRENLPEASIGAGLTSRIIFVYNDHVPDPVPCPPDKSDVTRDMTRELSRLAQMNGEVRMDQGANDAFNDIYCDWYLNSSFREHPMLRGYWGRRGDHLIKIAMILAVGVDHSFTITSHHIDNAREILEDTERNIPAVLSEIASGNVGIDNNHVAVAIRKAGRINRSDLMRRLSYRMDAEALDKALVTLKESRQIREEIHGRTTTYEWRQQETS